MQSVHIERLRRVMASTALLTTLAGALIAYAAYAMIDGVLGPSHVVAIVAALSCSGLLAKFAQVNYRRLIRFEEEFVRNASTVRELLTLFQATVDNMPQGVALYDREQRILLANARYAEMYGLSEEDCRPGASMRDILEKRALNGVYIGADPATYVDERIAAMTNPFHERGVERFTDGRIIEKSRKPMPGGGWLSVHEDVTERQRAEDSIAWMARHDALTGLANRAVLRERIDESFLRTRRTGEEFAVLLLDLDDFKIVNDTMGHPAGDRLLQLVADRLRETVRDLDLVARIGGDEFAIVMHADAPRNCHPEMLAERLMRTICEPYDIDGSEAQIRVSIGVALAPADGEDGGALLKNADLALYQAKEAGRRCVRFFSASMDSALRSERSLESDLRNALLTNQLEVHYQAVVDTRSGDVIGMEALSRWRHRELGMVPPDRFVKIAERTGQIAALGAWVLRAACAQARDWPEHIKLAVNLSPAQFKSGDLVALVKSALEETGLPASRLTLEITETTVLERTDGNLAALRELRELGVAIALDDFGTGYSSLSYLRTIPFDVIKIDRDFIKEMQTNERSAHVVAGIVALSRSLGFSTVAEGIETREQLDFIRRVGCGAAQGFLFARPKPASELEFGVIPEATTVLAA